MPSPAELVAGVMLALQLAPPQGAGPRATSNEGERYDAIGYAKGSDLPNGVAHAELAIGTHVEVTALDSGRTVLFAVTGHMAATPGEPVGLSPDAMRQLGVGGTDVPVRIRSARALPTDIAALNAGQPAGARLDAPPALLAGLRKALPPRARTVARPVAPAPASPKIQPSLPVGAPALAPLRGWGVQVAALSNEARARALANELGGAVRPGGALFRVQLGPYADRAAAEAARLRVVRQGQPQATLVHIP